jgi:hypothetical protein
MIDFSKLLFLPLDIPPPPDVTRYFDIADNKDFLIDNYRNCRHLPIMTVNRKTGNYNYTNVGKEIPELVNWLETHIFNWADRGDVVIITTQPNELNPLHIDCSPEKFAKTIQHKFRYVFRGRIDTLHFEHNDGIVTPNHIDLPFVMSGKWPHYMLNGNNIKYTLALGAPWDPTLSDARYIQLLQRSYDLYKNYYKSFDSLLLKDGWFSLFEKGRGYEDQIKIYLNN